MESAGGLAKGLVDIIHILERSGQSTTVCSASEAKYGGLVGVLVCVAQTDDRRSLFG